MMAPFKLDIPRRGRTCSHGEERFETDDEYHSVLIDQEEEIVRRDFCAKCWQEVGTSQDIAGHTHWKGKVPEKRVEKMLDLSRDEKALELLKEALESEESGAEEEAFVLGLYLERRRLISRRKEVPRDGALFALYEVLATEEMLTVKTIPLSQLAVKGIQARIAEKLNA
jgi:hypothetical protein